MSLSSVLWNIFFLFVMVLLFEGGLYMPVVGALVMTNTGGQDGRIRGRCGVRIW